MPTATSATASMLVELDCFTVDVASLCGLTFASADFVAPVTVTVPSQSNV